MLRKVELGLYAASIQHPKNSTYTGIQDAHLRAPKSWMGIQNACSMTSSSDGLPSECLNVDKIILTLLASEGKPAKKFSIPESQLRLLCLACRHLFLHQSSLLELEAPLVIVGDLHGQFDDLLRHLSRCGHPPHSNYLFLGDYVDRGKQSLETITLILAYKVRYPENVFLLRGNHECASINRIYGFYDECKRRYSIKLWKTFTDCFNCLPFAALIEDTIFCMHGGLSPDLKNIDQLKNIPRPMEVPNFGLVCDLLWSDPDKDVTGWGVNDRGVSYTFGGDVVREFVKKQKISLIVRAHQVVEDGYQFFQKRKLVTIFSASNYCGEFDNAGAVMIVSEDLTCSFRLLEPKVGHAAISKEKANSDNKKKKK